MIVLLFLLAPLRGFCRMLRMKLIFRRGENWEGNDSTAFSARSPTRILSDVKNEANI